LICSNVDFALRIHFFRNWSRVSSWLSLSLEFTTRSYH